MISSIFYPALLVSTRDTSFACAIGQIFYLSWQETLQAATSARSGLKGNNIDASLV